MEEKEKVYHLSFSKFLTFASNSGLVPQRYYLQQGEKTSERVIKFVESLLPNCGLTFILQIPSKYRIPLPNTAGISSADTLFVSSGTPSGSGTNPSGTNPSGTNPSDSTSFAGSTNLEYLQTVKPVDNVFSICSVSSDEMYVSNEMDSFDRYLVSKTPRVGPTGSESKEETRTFDIDKELEGLSAVTVPERQKKRVSEERPTTDIPAVEEVLVFETEEVHDTIQSMKESKVLPSSGSRVTDHVENGASTGVVLICMDLSVLFTKSKTNDLEASILKYHKELSSGEMEYRASSMEELISDFNRLGETIKESLTKFEENQRILSSKHEKCMEILVKVHGALKNLSSRDMKQRGEYQEKEKIATKTLQDISVEILRRKDAFHEILVTLQFHQKEMKNLVQLLED